MYTCALTTCDNEFDITQAYCIRPNADLTGETNIASFNCPVQHFCCSLDHAVLAAQACVVRHIQSTINGENPNIVYDITPL